MVDGEDLWKDLTKLNLCKQMNLSIGKYKGIYLEKNNLDHIYTMQSQKQL